MCYLILHVFFVCFFSLHLVSQLILSQVFGNIVFACQHFDVQNSQFILNTFEFLLYFERSHHFRLWFSFFFWSCSILRRNTQSAFRYQVRRSTLVLCNYPKAWMTTLGLFGMYYCNKVFHWCFAIMYSVYRCNKHSQAS